MKDTHLWADWIPALIQRSKIVSFLTNQICFIRGPSVKEMPSATAHRTDVTTEMNKKGLNEWKNLVYWSLWFTHNLLNFSLIFKWMYFFCIFLSQWWESKKGEFFIFLIFIWNKTINNVTQSYWRFFFFFFAQEKLHKKKQLLQLRLWDSTNDLQCFSCRKSTMS